MTTAVLLHGATTGTVRVRHFRQARRRVCAWRGGENESDAATRARGVMPGYFRMPRSAEVRASENAGRANSRSAYFSSGAACFGMEMP